MDSHKRDFSANARLPGIFALAACIGAVSTLAAFVLVNLIRLFTNLFFFGTLSFVERETGVPDGWSLISCVVAGLLSGALASGLSAALYKTVQGRQAQSAMGF